MHTTPFISFLQSSIIQYKKLQRVECKTTSGKDILFKNVFIVALHIHSKTTLDYEIKTLQQNPQIYYKLAVQITFLKLQAVKIYPDV